MEEMLVPLKLPPGVYRNGTEYQAAGRWSDANLVRFTADTIRPVGGWQRALDGTSAPMAALTGVPRAATSWATDTGDSFVAIGTSSKLYTIANETLTDVTPADFATARAPRVDAQPLTTGAYNAGGYGVGNYGVGSAFAAIAPPDTWSLDVFGTQLAAVPTRTGELYIWPGGGLAAPASGAPTNNVGVVMTPERFLTLLGAGGHARRVQWASQESSTVWDYTNPLNTAGFFDLATNGRLVTGRRTRAQTLLWTDADLWTMTYIGGVLLYRFDQVGTACGIVAPNAVATVDTQAFWMGRSAFFVFDGFAKPVPCDVADHVFSDFNDAQRGKVVATTISQYGEVWWFYPSAASTECDRYVVYNYREGHWSIGSLPRTAGVDAGATRYPLLVDPAGVVWQHESGESRGGAVPYLESGPVELGAGDRLMKLHRLVPDERSLGDVDLSILASMYPTDAEVAHGPFAVGQPTNLRVTARQVRLRIRERVANRSWRVGTLRFGLHAGGKR